MPIFAIPHTFSMNRTDGIWSRHDDPQMELGECYYSEKDAVKTCYIRYGEDVAVGDALTSRAVLQALAAGAGSGDLAVGTDVIEFPSGTFTTLLNDGLFTNDYNLRELRGHALLSAYDSAGPTSRQAIVISIKANELKVIWLTPKGTLDVALADATTKFDLSAPWILDKAEPGQDVVAIAQVAGEAKEFGLVLSDGLGRIQANNAIAAGATLYVTEAGSTDEGEVDDPATAQVQASIGRSLTPATARGELIWAHLWCKPISKIPYQSAPFFRGTRRPGEI